MPFMKSQRLKDTYFSLVRPVTKVNYIFHRWLSQFPSNNNHKDGIWVNLGSGKKYLDGFVNIEGNLFYKKDIWLDIRNGLPFPDNSVDALYACHLFEHFYVSELVKILFEIHRILKPEGGVRILVPSLEQAIDAYLRGGKEWFSDFPSAYESLGGRFSNFLLCDGQHRIVFDYSFLEELLKKTGFSNMRKQELKISNFFPYEVMERIEDSEAEHIQTSLIVEGKK